MNTVKTVRNLVALSMPVLCGALLTGYGDAARADDGQIYSGWECRASGSSGQSSARYIEYRYDGSVANRSSTHSINVVCPVLVKDGVRHLQYASVNYTDNHPDRSVRCSLYVDSSVGRRVYAGSSPEGTRSANLLLSNTAKKGTNSWVSCTLPPTHNNRKSAIHSFRANFSTGQVCVEVLPLGCFDGSGGAIAGFPAIAARLEERQPSAKPYFNAAAGYVGNLSEQFSLPVVFAVPRDTLTRNEAPVVHVSAHLKSDGSGLAQCRLFQTNNGFNDSFELEWKDPDGDGRGTFSGSGNDATVNEATVFSVHCVIPPRGSQGFSRLTRVSYAE